MYSNFYSSRGKNGTRETWDLNHYDHMIDLPLEGTLKDIPGHLVYVSRLIDRAWLTSRKGELRTYMLENIGDKPIRKTKSGDLIILNEVAIYYIDDYGFNRLQTWEVE
jgi:hypothetical protein